MDLVSCYHGQDRSIHQNPCAYRSDAGKENSGTKKKVTASVRIATCAGRKPQRPDRNLASGHPER